MHFIEAPVDAEVNAALAIFFHGLAEAVDGPRNQRARISILIFGDAVELVGDEGEGNIVGPVEILESSEQRPSEGGVAGRVCGEWRSEIRAGGVARRRAPRRPIRIALTREEWIARARPPWAGIVLADCCNGPPEVVGVFVVPAGDARVSLGEIQQRELTRVLNLSI